VLAGRHFQVLDGIGAVSPLPFFFFYFAARASQRPLDGGVSVAGYQPPSAAGSSSRYFMPSLEQQERRE